uniref:Uncharacterized protein n=1 Tax=Timema cristinae TaxID=61476 RepID=A0A7R9DEZ6_TIMCR|nr:unnamed protein product [Timema cristinae]
MEEEQDKSLATKMRDFLNSGLGSDVEVKVGKDSNLKAHLSTSEDKQTIANLTSCLIDEEVNLTKGKEQETALASIANRETRSRGHKPQFYVAGKQSNQTIRKPTCYNCQRKGYLAHD